MTPHPHEPSPPRGAGERILLADGDPHLIDLLSTTLALAGYTTAVAHSGVATLRQCTADPPDLLVLDALLPDIDAFTVCQRLTDSNACLPVLLVSARDDVGDRVAGLTSGADDYLTKPFHLSEFMARVHAILRRRALPKSEQTSYRCADLLLDDGPRRVRRGVRPIQVSPAEYRLLRYLLANTGQVISKDQIAQHVWQHQVSYGVIEKLVSRLRLKVDADPPNLIHTIRGFGYTLREPDEHWDVFVVSEGRGGGTD